VALSSCLSSAHGETATDAADENQSTLPFRTPLGTLNLPCCRYQGYCIWGLSYSILQELLALDSDLQRRTSTGL